MGNHQAGRAMEETAKIADVLLTRPTGTITSLDILDLICSPYKGCDADFDEMNPSTALGKLITAAFYPEFQLQWGIFEQKIQKDDDEWEEMLEHWHNTAYLKFKARYDLY